MTINLIDAMTTLEENEPLHLARILILLRAFSKPEDTDIEGITKLAKLDFLLRYPSYFEAALQARGVRKEKIALSEYERNTIEAKMVRYRFGPWDHRYRRFLNSLAVKGFVTLTLHGRKISINLTVKGRDVSSTLANRTEFGSISFRASMLAKELDLSATNLMKFVYNTFPELHNMDYNEAIEARSLLDAN